MKSMFILNRDEEIVAVLSGNSDDSGCHFFNALLTLEINKGTSLTFEVDSTESDVVKYVKEENMVVVNDGENYRLLIIKEVSDVHEDSCMKEVYCEDASAELIDELIYEEIKGKVEMGIALASILEGTRWEIGEVDNTYLRSLKSEYKLRTVLNGIQTLASDYDAEIDFTVEFAGNKIVARKVHMKQAFGRTLGKRFEFGKDITSIKRTVNTADIKTAIIPFGATDEETGEVLTIKDVSWSKPTNPFNKPLGQTYIEDEEATELWGYKGTDSKRRARWIAITFEDCTDANELINYAQLQLNRFNKPKISYEAEVIDLYRMMEDESYSHEKVGLGDLVNIIDHEFVPALALQSRVVKLELDLNDTSNSKVTLGTIVESIVDKDLKTQIEELNVKVSAVASNVDLSDIEDRLEQVEGETGTGRWEQIQEVNNLLFSNSVGYHYMSEDNGIWVFDRPANENPTKAVALKGGCIGLAKWDSQKQEWTVGTFIDGYSVNASMINTGTLKADRIETGALTVAHLNQELKTVINSVGDKADRTEVTTAIQTAVDEINLSVSTKYSTKTETSSAVEDAKAEAIAEAVESASSYADTKSDAVKKALTPLINDKASKTDVYTKSETYTKSQTDSAIKVAKESIELGVSNTYETKTNVETKISTATSSTLTSAKSYADTKKSEAITQAGKDADSKVSTAKSDLQGKIDLKASKTDVYTKTETYTRSETDSKIKVAKDEINLGVSNIYETKSNVETKINSAVNNVQIGGRNLILNSKTILLNGSDNSNQNCSVIENDYVKITPKYNGNVYNTSAVATSVTRLQGETYTLSFEILTPTTIGFYFYPSEHYTKSNYIVANSKWQKVSFTYTQTGADSSSKKLFGFLQLVAGQTYYYRNLKLEVGNKSTDWTPAPEDVQSAIDTKANSTDVYKKSETYTKTETDSKISVAKNDITLSVSNTYETKTNVASQVSSTLSSAKSYADTKKSEAISTASSDATTKSNNALTSAKSYADTKKTEAINSANATTDTKLKSYSTTTQMNSAIQVAKDNINLGVSKVEQIATSSLQGKMLYTDPTFKSGTNGINTYNNAGGGTVTVSRVAKSSDCPTTSGYMMQITTTGSASPGHGGFYWGTSSRANAIFITKIIAKIPSGCYLNWASNSTGTGGKSEWLTSNAGTGGWKEYIYKVTCGSSGTFSSTNYYYLSGGSAPITWYVAMATVFDITETSNIESRMASAEQKITPSAIISTVQSTINTAKTEAINSANSSTDTKLKNYATTSSLTQTSDSIIAKFEASGGSNLVRLSKLKETSNVYGFGLRNVDTSLLVAGKKYTLTVRGRTVNGAGSRYLQVYIYTPDWSWSNSLTIKETSLTTRSITFTATSDMITKGLAVTSYHYPSGGDRSGSSYIEWYCLTEGEMQSVWMPHHSEVQEGNTQIDASGVTVNNGALRVKNNAGTTVLSGDSNGNLTFTGTAKSQSGSQWVGLDAGGVTFQDWNRNEQMLRIGLAYFDSNRDMNGVNFAMPRYSDYLRFSHIVKDDLTGGWSSSDTQYRFMDFWSGSYTVGGIYYAKGIHAYAPLHIDGDGIFLRSGTSYTSDIKGDITWNTIPGLLGLTGDNGCFVGYKSGDSLQARMVLTEGAHPGTGDNLISWGHYNFNGYTFHNAKVNALSLSVSGSKNCLQKTENYGERLINAYETAEYYFGDLGFGQINEQGECFVDIDDIFLECVNTDAQYHVFTQVYEGSIKSIERHKTYFVVKGEPNTSFSWELKAKRIGYENNRLDVQELETHTLDSGLELFSDEDFKADTSEDVLINAISFDLEEVLLMEE